MEKKLKDIFEVLLREHMMVIRGGFAFYDAINNSKDCSTSNSNKTCDAVNAAKKDCHAVNQTGVCGAINLAVSCAVINGQRTSCSVINAEKICTTTSCI